MGNCITLCLSVLLGSGVCTIADEEPVYKGRPVREWLWQLKSPKIAERSAAVREFGPEAIVCVPAIIEALRFESLEFHDNSCNPEPRRWLAGACGRVGPEAVPLFRKALRDPWPSIRGWSAFILAHMPDETGESAAEVVGLLKDQDPGVRRLAAIAVSRMGKNTEAATAALVEALKDEDAEVRSRAAAILGWRGSQDLLPVLAGLLNDPSSRVRQSVVRVLACYGRQAVPHLMRALKDPDARVRQDAAHQIHELGPVASEAVEELIKVLTSDSDRDVRFGAAAAIGGLGPRAKVAVPALIEALKLEDRFVLDAVIRALGQIGPEAKAAVPALEELLQNQEKLYPPPQQWLRQDRDIEKALGKINCQSSKTCVEYLDPSSGWQL